MTMPEQILFINMSGGKVSELSFNRGYPVRIELENREAPAMLRIGMAHSSDYIEELISEYEIKTDDLEPLTDHITLEVQKSVDEWNLILKIKSSTGEWLQKMPVIFTDQAKKFGQKYRDETFAEEYVRWINYIFKLDDRYLVIICMNKDQSKGYVILIDQYDSRNPRVDTIIVLSPKRLCTMIEWMNNIASIYTEKETTRFI